MQVDRGDGEGLFHFVFAVDSSVYMLSHTLCSKLFLPTKWFKSDNRFDQIRYQPHDSRHTKQLV